MTSKKIYCDHWEANLKRTYFVHFMSTAEITRCGNWCIATKWRRIPLPIVILNIMHLWSPSMWNKRKEEKKEKNEKKKRRKKKRKKRRKEETKKIRLLTFLLEHLHIFMKTIHLIEILRYNHQKQTITSNNIINQI